MSHRRIRPAQEGAARTRAGTGQRCADPPTRPGSVRAAANSADRPCRRAGPRADSSAAGAAGSADPSDVNPQQGSCPPDGGSRRCSLHHRRGTIEEGSPGTVIERRSIFSNSSAPPLSVTSLRRPTAVVLVTAIRSWACQLCPSRMGSATAGKAFWPVWNCRTGDGPRVASEQKMQFSKAVAKLSNSAMACLSSVRLDFPCCKNQPQKSELLQ